MKTRERHDILTAKDIRTDRLQVGSVVLTESSGDLIALGNVTASAAEVNILDGATVTAAEINTLDGAAHGATFVIGAEATNVINVGIQLRDANNADLAIRSMVHLYLSDDANGDSIAATAPTGTVVIGTDGVLYDIGAAKKMFIAVSEADGDIDINITESGTKTFYLIVVLPNGRLVPSGAIAFS